MKSSFEAYKKIYIRLANVIIILLMVLPFYLLWEQQFNTLMDRQFNGKGNWLIGFSYIVFVCVFMQLWGGFKLGYWKLINLILSQFLAIICVNILTYIQVTLMIGTLDDVWIIAGKMLVLTMIDMLGCLLASVLFINIYVKLFPAHKVLQINGDYQNYLKQKIKDRDDKYQICEEVSVHTPWEILTAKMSRYDTILFYDIPSAFIIIPIIIYP